MLVTLRTHRLPLGEVPAGNRVPGEVPATAAPIGDMRHEAVGALPCGDVPSGIQLAAMLLLRCSCAACNFMQERFLRGFRRAWELAGTYLVSCQQVPIRAGMPAATKVQSQQQVSRTLQPVETAGCRHIRT